MQKNHETKLYEKKLLKEYIRLVLESGFDFEPGDINLSGNDVMVLLGGKLFMDVMQMSVVGLKKITSAVVAGIRYNIRGFLASIIPGIITKTASEIAKEEQEYLKDSYQKIEQQYSDVINRINQGFGNVLTGAKKTAFLLAPGPAIGGLIGYETLKLGKDILKDLFISDKDATSRLNQWNQSYDRFMSDAKKSLGYSDIEQNKEIQQIQTQLSANTQQDAQLVQQLTNRLATLERNNAAAEEAIIQAIVARNPVSVAGSNIRRSLKENTNIDPGTQQKLKAQLDQLINQLKKISENFKFPETKAVQQNVKNVFATKLNSLEQSYGTWDQAKKDPDIKAAFDKMVQDGLKQQKDNIKTKEQIVLDVENYFNENWKTMLATIKQEVINHVKK